CAMGRVSNPPDLRERGAALSPAPAPVVPAAPAVALVIPVATAIMRIPVGAELERDDRHVVARRGVIKRHRLALPVSLQIHAGDPAAIGPPGDVAPLPAADAAEH